MSGWLRGGIEGALAAGGPGCFIGILLIPVLIVAFIAAGAVRPRK